MASVLLLNGSPHAHGAIDLALTEVAPVSYTHLMRPQAALPATYTLSRQMGATTQLILQLSLIHI